MSLILLTPQNDPPEVIINKEFEEVILTFIDENSSIPNDCNARPYYGLDFIKYNGDTLIAITAFLGETGNVIPAHPDSLPRLNPKEKKGAGFVDNNLIVIYDFRNSDGYGIYDTSALDKNLLNEFNSLPDSCINLAYPGPVIYRLSGDNLIFKEKLDSFHLK